MRTPLGDLPNDRNPRLVSWESGLLLDSTWHDTEAPTASRQDQRRFVRERPVPFAQGV